MRLAFCVWIQSGGVSRTLLGGRGAQPSETFCCQRRSRPFSTRRSPAEALPGGPAAIHYDAFPSLIRAHYTPPFDDPDDDERTRQDKAGLDPHSYALTHDPSLSWPGSPPHFGIHPSLAFYVVSLTCPPSNGSPHRRFRPAAVRPRHRRRLLGLAPPAVRLARPARRARGGRWRARQRPVDGLGGEGRQGESEGKAQATAESRARREGGVRRLAEEG